jgi:hypothetical protein
VALRAESISPARRAISSKNSKPFESAARDREPHGGLFVMYGLGNFAGASPSHLQGQTKGKPD